MAKKDEIKETAAPETNVSVAKAKLNPYDGYYVSATLRGRRFLYKGDTLDANNLSPAQLERLASDEKFKHVTKKTN